MPFFMIINLVSSHFEKTEGSYDERAVESGKYIFLHTYRLAQENVLGYETTGDDWSENTEYVSFHFVFHFKPPNSSKTAKARYREKKS